MAKLYFKYGSGKSADLCETAYNYNEYGMNVVVINAKENKMVESKYLVNGVNALKRDIDLFLTEESIYDKIYYLNLDKKISCVLVDNAEYLPKEKAEDLFYIAKVLDIPVISYGNRTFSDGSRSLGAARIMELATTIEEIDKKMHNGAVRSKKALLEFYYGAMNSSKTAKLLYKASELSDSGMNICLMKPSLDRSREEVSSRIGMKRKADFIIESDSKIYGEGEYLYKNHINYILVDEAQFLSEKQIDELKNITRDFDIPVRCYGLKTDFMSYSFPGSQRLLEVSDTLVKLRTVCPCGKGASFNARRYNDGTYASSGDKVCIDNGSNYISLCSNCYLEKVMKVDLNNPKKLLRKK